ncbi:MAG: hypothetical protein MJ202_04455 [Lentisphaeria bacterium]|nr:hypothetical protein [Lentisphaeria bacterium]
MQNLNFRRRHPLLAFPDSHFRLHETAYGGEQNIPTQFRLRRDAKTSKNTPRDSRNRLRDFTGSFCLVCYFAGFAIRIFILEKTGNVLLQYAAFLQQPPGN